MTDDMIALQALLAKQPHADIVREMLGFTAQRLMELDVETKTGAAELVLSDAAGGIEGASAILTG
jgi:hypothetical protein